MYASVKSVLLLQDKHRIGRSFAWLDMHGWIGRWGLQANQ